MVAEEKSVHTIQAHKHEVLTCDWNKYNEFVLSTGSVDKTIRTWVCYPFMFKPWCPVSENERCV